MANNIIVNMENLSDSERKTLLALIEKANAPKATSPFEEAPNNEVFFFIDKYGDVSEDIEEGDYDTECLRAVGNYCTDEDLLERRAEREALNRLLWVYSMEHGGQDIKWTNSTIAKWSLWFYTPNKINTDYICRNAPIDPFRVYFITKEVAENAIKEIVEPFMRAHPEFTMW